MIDVFYRLYNKDLAKVLSPENVRVIQLDLPAETSIKDVIDAAHRGGASKGSSRSGIYEVQTDAGIWSRADGGKLDPSTPGGLARISFASWDELEGADKLTA